LESSVVELIDDVTINANVIHPVDLDEMVQGSLELNSFDDTDNKKCSLIGMSLKEQFFKFTYKTLKERNAEEHKKVIKMGRKPVDNNYSTYNCKVCQCVILTFQKRYICLDLSFVHWQIGLVCIWIRPYTCGLVPDARVLVFGWVFTQYIANAV